jgi:hypothetical protein
MHAVSITPHAPCVRCQCPRMNRACGVNDPACNVHAVSLTPHAYTVENFESLREFDIFQKRL